MSMKINTRGIAAYANSDAPAVRQGPLKKGIDKKMQRRWFVLKGNLLFYFKSESDSAQKKDPTGVICLEDYDVQVDPGNECIFRLLSLHGGDSGQKEFQLEAASSEEAAEWVDTLRTASFEFMRGYAECLCRALCSAGVAVPEYTHEDFASERLKSRTLRALPTVSVADAAVWSMSHAGAVDNAAEAGGAEEKGDSGGESPADPDGRGESVLLERSVTGVARAASTAVLAELEAERAAPAPAPTDADNDDGANGPARRPSVKNLKMMFAAQQGAAERASPSGEADTPTPPVPSTSPPASTTPRAGAKSADSVGDGTAAAGGEGGGGGAQSKDAATPADDDDAEADAALALILGDDGDQDDVFPASPTSAGRASAGSPDRDANDGGDSDSAAAPGDAGATGEKGNNGDDEDVSFFSRRPSMGSAAARKAKFRTSATLFGEASAASSSPGPSASSSRSGSTSSRTGSSSSAPRVSSIGDGDGKCRVCARTAYPMERVVADGVVFHKTCFRCAADSCNKVLQLGSYAAMEGEMFCKPCFKKMFMLKGNYAEGFGKEQHKMKWLAAGGGGEASA